MCPKVGHGEGLFRLEGLAVQAWLPPLVEANLYINVDNSQAFLKIQTEERDDWRQEKFTFGH